MANSLTAIAAQTTTDQTKTKDCKFCGKKGLMILPLRYSTMPVASKPPKVSGNCGGDACGIGLSASTYTLRMVRDGYIYLFFQRTGGEFRPQAYAASGEGYLARFSPAAPPEEVPQFTCEPNTCGRNASMISIEFAETVSTAYLLFTPTPFTVKRLTEICTVSACEKLSTQGLAVKFSPAQWVKGPGSEKHCLVPTQLPDMVCEFFLNELDDKIRSSKLFKPMLNAPFPLLVSKPTGYPSAAHAGALNLSRLDSLGKYMVEMKAMAIAMPDPIGIVQELNDHRNDALNIVENVNQIRDPSTGVTNGQKYNILQNINEVQLNFEQGIVRSRTDYKEYVENRARAQWEPVFADDSPVLVRTKRRALATRDPRAKTFVHPDRKQWAAENKVASANLNKELAEIERNYPQTWAKDGGRKEWLAKYEPLLDRDAMDTFDKMYKDLADDSIKAADQRAGDHLKWICDERFLVALDALYDKADLVSGEHFAIQANDTFIGMSGTKVGQEQVDKWLKAPSIERDNVFMRAYVKNQEDLRLAANEAFAQAAAATQNANAPSNIDGHALYKAFKTFASALKASDSAWDEYARDKKGQLAGMHTKWEGKKLFQLSEFTRSICRMGITKTEMAVVGRLGGLLHMATGPIADRLRFDELMFKIDPESPFKPEDPKKGNVGTQSYKEARANNATDMDPVKAKTTAAADAAQGKGLSRDLVQRAAEKREQWTQGLRLTIDETLEQTRAKGSTATNNYHQVRIGVALSGLEAVNFFFFVKEIREKGWANSSSEEVLKAIASGMSLMSMSLDVIYAHTKSVREISPNAALKGAGDIVRGGFKFAAGFLATGAGGISVWMDLTKLHAEYTGDKRVGALIVATLKLVSSTGTTVTGAVAAFSYSGPLLQRIVLFTAEQSRLRSVLTVLARWATGLAERVALLRWVARANWVGLAVLVVEVGYMVYLKFQPGAFEIWCQRSLFSKKPTAGNRYVSADEELKALESAIKVEEM